MTDRVEGATAPGAAWPRANLAAFAAALRRPARPLPVGGFWPAPGRLVAAGAAILLGLAAIMVLADGWAVAAARTLPRRVIDLFEIITDFGKSGWFLWPLGLMLAALALAPVQRLGRIGERIVLAVAVRLGFLFAAIAVPGLAVSILKRLIGRARPFVDDVLDPYRFDPFAWSAAFASFPSGHVTTACAAAVAIGALWPRARLVMWLYALLIAVSRVIVTAHHPSDVLAGAVCGVIGAVLVRNWFAARRLAFAIDADGHVRAMAGPSWRRLTRLVIGSTKA